MSRDVERVDVSRSQAAHRRAAELVSRQRRLTNLLDSFFREIGEVQELLRMEGSLWAGPVLDPPVEAAFNVWESKGPKETRVELDRIADPPMMNLETDDDRAFDALLNAARRRLGFEELPESDFA